MNIVQTILGMVRAVRPDVADRASDMMKNMSMNENGLRRFVQEQGGKKFLDEAERFANQAPRVQAVMKQFGVNTHDLRNTVEKALTNNPSSKQNGTPVSDYKERLRKMK